MEGKLSTLHDAVDFWNSADLGRKRRAKICLKLVRCLTSWCAPYCSCRCDTSHLLPAPGLLPPTPIIVCARFAWTSGLGPWTGSTTGSISRARKRPRRTTAHARRCCTTSILTSSGRTTTAREFLVFWWRFLPLFPEQLIFARCQLKPERETASDRPSQGLREAAESFRGSLSRKPAI